jgi:hypothetical protein
LRTRYIKPGVRNRFVVRGPFTEDFVHVSKFMIASGFKTATFLQYWKHVVFWRRSEGGPKDKTKKLNTNTPSKD